MSSWQNQHSFFGLVLDWGFIVPIVVAVV